MSAQLGPKEKRRVFQTQSLAVDTGLVSMVALGCKQTLLFPVAAHCISLVDNQAAFLMHTCTCTCHAHVHATCTHTHTHIQARPATTSFSKRSHQIQSEGASHHQIGRVPPLPLFDKGGSSPSLELHSSPVHLATRSLSARAVHSSSAVRSSSTVSLPSSLKQSSLGAPVTASKSERSSGKRHSARNSGKSKVRKYMYVSLVPSPCNL